MAVVAKVILRGVSPEQYDAVRAEDGWLDRPPVGWLGHLTWWEGADCHIVDAWESEREIAAFEQRLGPVAVHAGVGTAPERDLHTAHEVFLPKRQVIAPTDTSMGMADNARMLRRGYEAFARGDIKAVLALFDPGMIWSTPDSVRFGGSYQGPAGVAEFFAHLRENFAELHVEPHTFVEQGDCVVVLGTHRGRAASGAAFEIPFVHVWTTRGGKAITFTEHLDTAKLNAVLAIPAQAGTAASEAPTPTG